MQTIRNAHKCGIVLTEEEQWLSESIVEEYIDERGGIVYDMHEDVVLPKGAILGLIQKKRMIASCVQGYSMYQQAGYDVEAYIDLLQQTIHQPDAKVDELLHIFKGIQCAGGNKVIVFAMFKFTIYYLEVRLRALGYKVYSIHGDIVEREAIISDFKESTEFAILLSSEVGSEGLDMQFCSHLINYDLPWNPMVVEQRIGRIDRFGQKASKIHIYNMVIKDSIQENIYDRLLDRIGIFQNTIGELEVILEDPDMRKKFSQLESDVYSMQLTPEEEIQRVNDMAKALENQKLILENVESGLTNSLTNDVYFQNEINKIRNQKLYVSEQELVNYIKMLVEECLKTFDFSQKENNIYALRVPKSEPRKLTNFLNQFQPIGEDFDNMFRSYRAKLVEDIEYSNIHEVTFQQEYAFENKQVDYVNIYNPLIIAASAYFKKQLDSLGQTFQMKLESKYACGLSKGEYYLAVYAITTCKQVLGKVIASDVLLPVIYSCAKDAIIEEDYINFEVFGNIQEYSEYLELHMRPEMLSDQSVLNMEYDFTEYVGHYIANKLEETHRQEESQQEMRLRRLEEYYMPREEKLNHEIAGYEYTLELYADSDQYSHIRGVLGSARGRLSALLNEKAERMSIVRNRKPSSMSSAMVSLSQLIIY